MEDGVEREPKAIHHLHKKDARPCIPGPHPHRAIQTEHKSGLRPRIQKHQKPESISPTPTPRKQAPRSHHKFDRIRSQNPDQPEHPLAHGILAYLGGPRLQRLVFELHSRQLLPKQFAQGMARGAHGLEVGRVSGARAGGKVRVAQGFPKGGVFGFGR